jgi:CRISPR-associated protein Cas2
VTFQALSGYRIMWVMTLFDLPVLTPEERHKATKFREFLLDQGFCMMQLSCYIKFTAGKEQAEALTAKIETATPPGGKVDVLYFTDRQYESIKSFYGKGQRSRPEKPGQLQLF